MSAPDIAGPYAIAARSAEAVLRQLPQWFGIETALLEYADQAQRLLNFAALIDGVLTGFVTMREHNPATLELTCLAVVPNRHNSGIGSLLCSTVEGWWRDRGGKLLQVKTLGPTRPNAHYESTRRFYEARGFFPVEEFADLWPGIPCLLLVKPI